MTVACHGGVVSDQFGEHKSGADGAFNDNKEEGDRRSDGGFAFEPEKSPSPGGDGDTKDSA